MATDPFKGIANVTEDNFLSIRIESLQKKDLPESFKRGLDNLIQIKRILEVVNKVGRLYEVGARSYMVQAIQWLNGETPITNFISVPQIPELSSIDETIAINFEQFTHSLLQAFRSEPMYSQIETMMAVSAATRSSRSASREKELLDGFEEKALVIVQTKQEDIRTASQQASTAIEQVKSTIDQQLSERQGQINQEMSGQLDAAISRFQQAQALEDWGKVYDADIAEYERRLFGRHFAEGTVARNIGALSGKIVRSVRRKDNVFSMAIKMVRLIAKNFSTLFYTIVSRLFSYSAKRTVTFSLLVIFVLGVTIFSLAPSLGITHIGAFKIPNIGNPSSAEWYLRLVIYLPPVVLLGLAYSFAVKNYRIYSNILDQYRHRRAVAKTSQGVILSLRPVEDEAVRTQMTSAAALALFEMRNTGHLTKNEAESLSLIDFLKIGR